MNETALVFSDLHLKPETKETCEKVLHGMIQAAVDGGIHHIVFLGDFFHLRYTVPVDLINLVSDWLADARLVGIHVHFLVGNHDQVDELGRNALEVFGNAQNATVHSEIGESDGVLWLPYRKDYGLLKEAIKSSTAKTCFGHFAMNGAMMNNHFKSEHGLGVRDLDKFDLVLLGHFHKRQSFGARKHIHYVGSPWETSAAEIGQPKGYVKLLTPTTFEYVDTHWGAKHHNFSGTAKAFEKFVKGADIKPGDKVFVESKSKKDLESIATKLRGLYSANPIPKLIEADKSNLPRIAMDPTTSLGAFIDRYVNANLAEGLDKASLMDILSEIGYHTR
jgi:DNA repair exonuclease SbcCD nuclease subunit